MRLGAIALSSMIAAATPLRGQVPASDSDRQAIISLENEWLTASDSATLDRILAPDFVHPVATGDFLTKSQHIHWMVAHPPPASLHFRFDRLDVRVYGNVGIANGIVGVAESSRHNEGQTVFTDVFARRNGRWPAVSGQETPVGLAAWIEGLLATGPDPAQAERLRLFSQFVGEWSIDVVSHRPSGERRNAIGQWNFGWVLDGRAIQDVTIIRADTLATAPIEEYGTAVRFYDARLDAWRVVWVGPRHGNVTVLTARALGDSIVLTGSGIAGSSERWVFSEITPRAFRWRGYNSRDDGKTWFLAQEIFARRRQ